MLLDFSCISGLVLCICSTALEMTVDGLSSWCWKLVRKAVVILGGSNEVTKLIDPKL